MKFWFRFFFFILLFCFNCSMREAWVIGFYFVGIGYEWRFLVKFFFSDIGHVRFNDQNIILWFDENVVAVAIAVIIIGDKFVIIIMTYYMFKDYFLNECTIYLNGSLELQVNSTCPFLHQLIYAEKKDILLRVLFPFRRS